MIDDLWVAIHELDNRHILFGNGAQCWDGIVHFVERTCRFKNGASCYTGSGYMDGTLRVSGIAVVLSYSRGIGIAAGGIGHIPEGPFRLALGL